MEALARELQGRGVDVVIAAPGERAAEYACDGLHVWRFAVTERVDDVRDLYGEGDPGAAREFGRILDAERPDAVHLHALTRGVSLLLAREAARRRLPTVFTYHTPTVSCQRGTLMRWGRQTCDGRLDAAACARCTLDGLGAGRAASLALGSLPAPVGRVAGALGLSGGLWTAVRMRELVTVRHATVRRLLAEVDRVVALCDWTRTLLERIGVDPRKITVSRHGLADVPAGDPAPPGDDDPGVRPVRAAFLGRLSPTKGPDTVIRGLRAAPDARLLLDLYGVVQEPGESRYLREIEALAAGDPRIRFLPTLPHERVVPVLREHDVLVVPSRWLETGPLVVLEAFAAGIPVIGSRLGGIVELVRDGVDGMLVDEGSTDAWAAALRRVASDPGLLRRLRAGVRPPRSMAAVADEMLALYAGLS